METSTSHTAETPGILGQVRQESLIHYLTTQPAKPSAVVHTAMADLQSSGSGGTGMSVVNPPKESSVHRRPENHTESCKFRGARDTRDQSIHNK